MNFKLLTNGLDVRLAQALQVIEAARRLKSSVILPEGQPGIALVDAQSLLQLEATVAEFDDVDTPEQTEKAHVLIRIFDNGERIFNLTATASSRSVRTFKRFLLQLLFDILRNSGIEVDIRSYEEVYRQAEDLPLLQANND